MEHGLIGLLIAAIVLGAIIYLLDYLPIDGRFIHIAKIIAIVIFIIYLIKTLAVFL